MGEAERDLLFLALQAVACGEDPPWLVSVRRFTCRVKHRKEIEKSINHV